MATPRVAAGALFFDGGNLTAADLQRIAFRDGEVSRCELASSSVVDSHVPPSLSRRIATSVVAHRTGLAAYAEHGIKPA